MAKKKVDEAKIKVGNIADVSGEINIAVGDIYKGFTAEQVSVLIAQITTTLQPKKFDGRCPYKGLDVFDEEDAELFFGRERLVEDLVSCVKESRTVFITGPSGSGKSSLVRAGLIHALKKEAIKGSHRWLYETMNPGREPINKLALAFSRLKSPELANYFHAHAGESNVLNECAESILSGHKDQRFILFVDQFEEIFSPAIQETERAAFLNMLAHSATIENGRIIVLFAMRSDFVSNCAAYPALNELLNQEFRQIGAMQPEELVSAIALPAKQVGLPIEDELIACIINDMKGEPGALPLMQFALKELFEAGQAKGGIVALTLSDYLDRKGIQEMLARYADDTFHQLSKYQQDLAHSIFSGLIEIGRDTTSTRRTAFFDDLVPTNAEADDVLAVVQKLADARLIITDEQAGKDTVTISHEKLIDAWPWLKKLVSENQDMIALKNEIIADASEWDQYNQDASYLYSGARLVNANEQLKSNKLVLSGMAFKYIRAGQARQRRGRMARIGGIAAIMTLLVFAAIIFSRQASANAELAQLATSRQLAAQAFNNTDIHYDLAALLGVEAYNPKNPVEARSALLTGFQRHPNLIGYLQGHHSPIIALLFNPKQNILVSAGKDGQIFLWDVKKQKALYTFSFSADKNLTSLSFSPDGQILVAEYDNNTWEAWKTLDPAHSTITQISPDWCSVTCPQNIYVPTPSTINIPDGHNGPITDMATNPDGNMLVSGSTDNTLIVWDISETPDWATGNFDNIRRLTMRWQGHPTYVNRVAWSADGEIIASGDEAGNILLWSPLIFVAHSKPTNGQRVKGTDIYGLTGTIDWTNIKNAGIGFVFTKATEGLRKDRMFDVNWDALRQQGIPRGAYQVFQPGIYTVQQAEYFSEQVKMLPGDLPPVVDLENIPKDSLNEDVLANLEIFLSELERKTGRRPIIYSRTFLFDSKLLDRSSRFPEWLVEYPLWIAQYPLNSTGIDLGQPIMPKTWPGDWAFWQYTDHGKVKGIQASDGQDTETNLNLYNGSVTDLASALMHVPFPTQSKDISIPDLNGGAFARSLKGQPGPVNTVFYSKSGKWLASGSADGKLILWNMQGNTTPVVLQQGGFVIYSISISPDEDWLAVGQGDGNVQIWDLKTLKLRTTLSAAKNRVTSVTFDEKSKLIAASGCGELVDALCKQGQIMIWRLSDLHAGILIGHSDTVNSIAFSPDNKFLVSGSEDGTMIFWKTSDWTTSDPIRASTAAILNLAFSHNGKWLASAGTDGTVSIWDVSKRQLSGEPLKGHAREVFSLSFNNDDSLLASGGWDKTIILWDINSHQQVGNPLRGHTDYIFSLAFSPDGKTLASGSWDNTIVLWNVDLHSWIRKACQIAGRNFSHAEWLQYFPETNYPTHQENATCPEWSLEPEITHSPTIAP